MDRDPAANLTDVELDALWTIYEGYSLLIERPNRAGTEPSVHAVLSVAYEDDEAVAEVAEVPLDVAQSLIDKGYLDPSEDGPVLSEDNWYDEELGCEVFAEEYVLSELGEAAIGATADDVDEGSDEGSDDGSDEDLEGAGRNDDEDDEDDDEGERRSRGGAWDDDPYREPYGEPDDDDVDDDVEDDEDDEDDDLFDEDDDEIRAD